MLTNLGGVGNGEFEEDFRTEAELYNLPVNQAALKINLVEM